MAVRIGWDKYEVALLIDACNKIRDKKIDKAECVHKLSKLLRQRAKANGIKIDEAYEVTIEGEMRKTYACDESLTGEGVYSDSNAKRDNWEKYESKGYLVYRVDHKWYIADVLSTQ